MAEASSAHVIRSLAIFDLPGDTTGDTKTAGTFPKKLAGATICLKRGFKVQKQPLAELMMGHGIGVAEEHAYSVKKIDYFEEA